VTESWQAGVKERGKTGENGGKNDLPRKQKWKLAAEKHRTRGSQPLSDSGA